MTNTGPSRENEKTALRSRLLERRRAMPPGEREAAARSLAYRAMALLPSGEAPTTVAAYVSTGAEPGTRALLEELRTQGARVLLPVLLPDNDLDWSVYDGPEGLRPAGRGLLEPAGPRLGPEAVCEAALVLLPGLAVDRYGRRLGRGGGSYDRVLARLAAAGSRARLVTLLYDLEYLEEALLPAEPHDQPVNAVVTPGATHHLA